MSSQNKWVYVVIRELQGNRAAVIGVFHDPVEADDKCGAWASEWFEKTHGLPADFSVVISPYYK